MATQKFKLANNNASFPFLFSRASRSVVQPGLDTASRTSLGFVGSPESFDYNLIKMIYCENVFPISEGVQSVGTQEDFGPYAPPATDFDQFITIRDSQERNFMFSPGRGKNYVLSNVLGTWTSYDSFVWNPTKNIVSKAYVDGRTFICYEADRIIEWDPVGSVFNTIAVNLPAGYTMADIRSIAGASNYLLLFTNTEVLWSSTLDILEFDDPLVGKSGKQIPIDLKGQITAGIPISGGFVVYSTRNAVGAFFTNNADTPFTFREITNSGGVSTYEQVTGDANQTDHYCYGSSGLQKLNLQRADSVFPDCTDFLASKEYEAWNAVTKEIEHTTLVGILDIKLQLLANRYLIISYGKLDNLQFTFALIHDLVLMRWGKVRVQHVDVAVLPVAALNELALRIFELTAQIQQYDIAIEDLNQLFGDVLPIRAGFAFLQNTGAIHTLVSETSADLGDGLAIIGHVQVTRGRTCTFQMAQFDNLNSDPVPTLTLLGSIPGDGFNRNSIKPVIATLITEKMIRYNGRHTFENFDLALEGKFNLTTSVVETTVNGSR